LKQTFRPEFLNRIDEVIIFRPLTEEQIRQIVDLQIKEVQKRLADRKITVTLTDKAKEWLANTGFDPAFGARPLKRTIQREVETPLSKKIIQGEVKEGDEVKVDLSTEGLVFSTNSG
jgi:ATP-dependent Clp protease ATP-binding subunit ClpB